MGKYARVIVVPAASYIWELGIGNMIESRLIGFENKMIFERVVSTTATYLYRE
jgi:hypothetical protein